MNILKKLCDTLFMSEAELLGFSSSCPHRYKTYEIKKRRSPGTRTIAHPSKELKFIQRLLVRMLEEDLAVHECASAYKKGASIRKNAEHHLNSKYLLKMDFKNFFPSITPTLLLSCLKSVELELAESDSKLLADLLFWKPRGSDQLRLSIGAPSSPLISNFVMFDFDEAMEKICEGSKVTYTRYADDLTFSTNEKRVLFSLPELVSENIHSLSDGAIEVNKYKTIFSSKAHNRHVTGVVLTNNNNLSVGRERKRRISAMVHQFKHELMDEEEVAVLRGYISFVTGIEPNFYLRMCKKYGEETLIRLTKNGR